MKASFPRLISNYIAAMSLIGIAYCYYVVNPYYIDFFSSTYKLPGFEITDRQILTGILWFYAICLIPYYATFNDKFQTKSRLVWRAVFHLNQRAPEPEERVALLATMVKFFFLPLMAVWMFANFSHLYSNGAVFWKHGNFFPDGYWMLFNLIVWIDVAFFVLAYSIEHPVLKNEIRSVEPTMLGWAVALICYPPFNGITNQVLGWYSSDYPEIETLGLRYVAAIAMLALMFIYLWATIALNIKASNLTNRGIVTGGPYAYVRHPAYIAKNMAWWIGALPILYAFWHKGIPQFFYAAFCIGTWTYIYYLRAMTEERHLMQDPDYQAYCKRVTRRFIPHIPGLSRA